jgi:hypothetical protein
MASVMVTEWGELHIGGVHQVRRTVGVPFEGLIAEAFFGARAKARHSRVAEAWWLDFIRKNLIF